MAQGLRCMSYKQEQHASPEPKEMTTNFGSLLSQKMKMGFLVEAG